MSRLPQLLFIGACVSMLPRASRASQLPETLAGLPAETSVAFHVPRARLLFAELERMRPALSLFVPAARELEAEPLLALLAWGHAPGEEHTARPSGLDPEGPVFVRATGTLDAAVIVLPVADPEKTKAWLLGLPTPSLDRVQTELGEVVLIAEQSSLPVACVVGEKTLTCQIGHPVMGGLSPLLAQLRPAGPRLGAMPAMVSGYAALPDDADWTALIRPAALATALANRWSRTMEFAHRLHPAAVRKEVHRKVAKVHDAARSYAHLFEGIALAGRSERGRSTVRAVVQTSPTGAAVLGRWLGPSGGGEALRTWASSPALFGLFLRAQPRLVASIAEGLGVDLPDASLDGTLALLTFGIDTHCPQARAEAGSGFAALFPSAVAVGLRGPSAAKMVPERFERAFSVVRELGQVTFVDTSARPPLVFEGRHHGRFELRVLDDVFLVGTGPLGAHAAVRRLSRSKEHAGPPSAEAPFFRAALDLAAVDAAISATRVEPEHRVELRWIDRMQRRLSPLLAQMRRVEVSAHLGETKRSLRLDLAMGR